MPGLLHGVACWLRYRRLKGRVVAIDQGDGARVGTLLGIDPLGAVLQVPDGDTHHMLWSQARGVLAGACIDRHVATSVARMRREEDRPGSAAPHALARLLGVGIEIEASGPEAKKAPAKPALSPEEIAALAAELDAAFKDKP